MVDSLSAPAEVQRNRYAARRPRTFGRNALHRSGCPRTNRRDPGDRGRREGRPSVLPRDRGTGRRGAWRRRGGCCRSVRVPDRAEREKTGTRRRGELGRRARGAEGTRGAVQGTRSGAAFTERDNPRPEDARSADRGAHRHRNQGRMRRRTRRGTGRRRMRTGRPGEPGRPLRDSARQRGRNARRTDGRQRKRAQSAGTRNQQLRILPARVARRGRAGSLRAGPDPAPVPA